MNNFFTHLDLLGKVFRAIAEKEGGEDKGENDNENRDGASEAVDNAPGCDGRVSDEVVADILDNLGNRIKTDDLGSELAEAATGV